MTTRMLRALALLAGVGLLAVALVACDGDDADETTPTATPTEAPTESPTATGAPTETPTPGTPDPTGTATIDFQAGGVLVRDNPGLPPGVWFLLYEEPGAPALSVALEFTDGSVCTSGGDEVSCEALEPGTRVQVQGVRTDQGVAVVTLDVEGADVEPDARIMAQVFFLDEERYSTGAEPFVVGVDRQLAAPAVAAAALDALFQGPTADEEARDLRLVASGATGAHVLRVEDGVAHVALEGGCDSMGATFTVAQLIIPTLTQFETIEFVKIYDPEGTTEVPDGRSDSIPFCLEP